MRTPDSRKRELTVRQQFFSRVLAEVERAYRKHGRKRWGRHEFYAIIKEELDEVWDNIRHDGSRKELEKEIIQVVAMALRYMETGDRYGHK